MEIPVIVALVQLVVQDPYIGREIRINEFINKVSAEHNLGDLKFFRAPAFVARYTYQDMAFAKEDFGVIFDPKWFRQLSEEEVKAAAAHELGHFYLKDWNAPNQFGADLFALRYAHPLTLVSALHKLRSVRGEDEMIGLRISIILGYTTVFPFQPHSP